METLVPVTSRGSTHKFSPLGIIAWLIGALFFLYEFFLRTFLGSLAQQIIPELHLSPSQFALLASVFYVAYGLMQVPAGAIVDRFGSRLSVSVAALICGLSALLFSYAGSFGVALIARFFMGFGGGFAFICVLIITMQWFPERYLGLFVGLGQFIGTMGAICAGGPLAAAVVAYPISWRHVFVDIAWVGFLLAILAILLIRQRSSQSDLIRILSLSRDNTFNKIKLLFQSHQAWWVAVYSAFVFLSTAMLGAVWGASYLQSLGFSQQSATTIVSFAWLGFALGCPGLGALSDYMHRRKLIMLICSFVGLVCSILIVYIQFSYAWIYSLLFFLMGFFASGQSIGFAIITELVPPESKSVAMGLNSAFITLLAAVLPVVIGVVIQHVAGVHVSDIAHYTRHDFLVAFSILPVLYGLSFLIGVFLIDETFCRSKMAMVVLDVSA